ncbi:MAG TPA: LysR family transcriptional regulator [Myxococcota bacterium]|nr:LysR family transcriptional regulator [Myxococcota bacterium]
MECEVRLRLLDSHGQPFMGIGLVWLLERIGRLRSVSAAARDMKLSYPKAMRMIRDLENGLGRKMVMRSKGGARRGGAELTDEAADFIARYEVFQARIKDHAQKEFRKAFFTKRGRRA